MEKKINKQGVPVSAWSDIPAFTGGMVLANQDESVKLSALPTTMRQWSREQNVSAGAMKRVLAKLTPTHKGWHLVKM